MVSDKKEYSISVVIPAYNAGKYVSRAIDSALAQSQPADEIIVIDDGSKDDTAEVIARYESKIKYIYQDNTGASVARNTGIKAAKSEWIAFLDADDEWLPQKLEWQIEHIKRNPDLVWTTGNLINCVCRKNRRAPHIEPAEARKLLSGKEYLDDYFWALPKSVDGWTGTMLIQRDILIEAGLFRPGQLRANDYDMWWRIAYRWPKIGYLAEPLAIYHLDVEGSIIRKHKDSTILCDLIERHLKMAEEHGRLEEFRACAVYLLRRWMRSMLFEAQGEDIRGMLKQFDELLPGGYKMFMRALTTFPKATAVGCRGISRIVRLLGLRKRLVRSR